MPLIQAVGIAYLESLGLSGGTSIYIPLTSEVLTMVNPLADIVDEEIIASEIVDRWQEDMSGIQNSLLKTVQISPEGLELAQGSFDSLLDMKPNGQYLNIPSYADPPLPWEPTLATLPLTPTIENAANILVRTFSDAHVADWCRVMTVEGSDEFALDALADRCQDGSLDPEAQEVACAICAERAAPHLREVDGVGVVVSEPLCSVIAPGSVSIDVPSGVGVASAWCSDPFADMTVLGDLVSMRVAETLVVGYSCPKDNGIFERSESVEAPEQSPPVSTTSGTSQVDVSAVSHTQFRIEYTTTLPPAVQGTCPEESYRVTSSSFARISVLLVPLRSGRLVIDVDAATVRQMRATTFASRADFEAGTSTAETFETTFPASIDIQTDGLQELEFEMFIDGGDEGIAFDREPVMTARFVAP